MCGFELRECQATDRADFAERQLEAAAKREVDLTADLESYEAEVDDLKREREKLRQVNMGFVLMMHFGCWQRRNSHRHA